MTDITGTALADALMGTSADDHIKGQGGADWLAGQDGNDRVKGGGGADILLDGAGIDRLWGGNGADRFVLSADGERDVIRDWEAGDVIDISAWGVTDIAELTIMERNNGSLRVTFGDETLIVKGKGGATLTLQDLGADDFGFLPTGPRMLDFEALAVEAFPAIAPIGAAAPAYGGFAWDGMLMLDTDKAAANPQAYPPGMGADSGALNKTSSGDMVAFATSDGMGFRALDTADNFDFEQVTAGSLYRAGHLLRIIGLDDGQYAGEQVVQVSPQSSTVIDLDNQIFDSVDQIVFNAFGGSSADALGAIAPYGNGYYIDDLVIG